MEMITTYEVLFTARTGVTILLPKTETLAVDTKIPASFSVSGNDVTVLAGRNTMTIKALRKEHIDAAVRQGFIMFYETEKDEVVRCTPCGYQKN